jgi:hypothetical protein
MYKNKEIPALSEESHIVLQIFLATKENVSIHSFWQQQYHHLIYEIGDFDNQSISIWDLLKACSNLDYLDNFEYTLKIWGFKVDYREWHRSGPSPLKV